MDVSCEKCGTIYELDEAKLKPGGVTVKCSNCSHMFRVRKRSPTNVAVPPVASRGRTEPPPIPRESSGPVGAPSGSTPPPGGTPMPSLKQTPGAAPRVWLIRDEDGKVQTCRELATLQQWVVAGRVTRNCEISRTGKSWKKLGAIAELGSFFRIAEEARDRARSSVSAAPVPVPAEGTEPLPGAIQPPGPVRGSTPPPKQSPAPAQAVEAAARAPSAPVKAPVAKEGSGPSGVPRLATGDGNSGPSTMGDVAARTTGGWAAAPKMALDDGGSGPAGPTGGLAKGIPTTEAAFAAGPQAGKIGKVPAGTSIDDLMPSAFEPIDAFDDDFSRPASSAGKWIVFVSLLVLGAAAGAVYFFVFRGDGAKAPVVAATTDAATAVPEPPGTPDAPPAADPTEVVTATYADLAADTDLSLEAASARFASVSSDDPAVSAKLLAARARVITAQAQHLLDLSDGASDAKAKATAMAKEAEGFATQALAADKQNRDAEVAMADAMRVKGASTRAVERHLGVVLKGDPKHREALFVRAQLRERDGKAAEARRIYTDLSGDGADTRPLYRLARLDYAEKKYEVAKTRADRVLGMQSEHTGAQMLAAKIDEATKVVTTDPMPPEVDDNGGGTRKNGGGSSGGGGNSYDAVLARAEKAAEAGNCNSAMDNYRRALDINPAGVAALVGMGYCHIDAKQFASAHAKFRAALGISPRHHGALIGVAEAYRYQGLQKQAIKAYQAYLDMHPSGPKAPMAKKQIERLGGTVGGGEAGDDGASGGDGASGDDGSGGGDSAGGGETPPDPKPDPEPEPEVEDELLDDSDGI